jgi:hypothetical protein
MEYKLLATLFIIISLYVFYKIQDKRREEKEQFTDYQHHTFVTDNYNYLHNTFGNLLYQFPKKYWKKRTIDETLYDKEIRGYLYDWHSPDLY